MATQDTQATADPLFSSSNFPRYDKDEEIFASFLREHTILTLASARNDDSDDDDVLMEPTADGVSHGMVRNPCYLPLLQRIKDRHYLEDKVGTFIIEIPLSELIAWDSVKGGDLAERATNNANRYQEVFAKVIDEALKGMEESPNANIHRQRDTIDVLAEQRIAQQQASQQARAEQQQQQQDGGGGILNDQAQINNAANSADISGATEEFPPDLMRRYEIRILPVGRRGVCFPFTNQWISKHNSPYNNSNMGLSLRDIRSRSMGKIVAVRGMIVRTSDVKPFCAVATYYCDACGCEVYQVIANQREFMPQRSCPSEECRTRRGGGDTLHLQTRGSKFVKFQELKIQELPSQVPIGHVPRSMSVYCRGELTRMATPGDVVTIDGIFLPRKLAESGFAAIKAGLISTTYLESQNIIVHKKSYDESLLDSLSDEESAKLDAEIMTIATGEDPVGKLSSSLAPEIFGHEDIKRALLLQLVGGCTRSLPDGLKIRGDINVCLMGDPGVAKSQLLKHVASIAPRGVYTTGKGSSGVGLTAAVTKDTTTGEMALEGGALVLADRGICCIDEFDKMDESDRTAIHEVMEQQTVSIAKAGIVATLNARAAVLAAANPLYSRYNRHKSLSENVNLPNSLLSRFDLLFLVLDIADVDRDTALARHVTLVHQNEGVEETNNKDKQQPTDASDNAADDGDDDEGGENADKPLAPRVLREYIARARKHQPVVPQDVAPYVVEAYVTLRMQDRPGAKKTTVGGDQTVMTARQLLSILRLSQALARLRFSDYVAREDVDEAIRLTHMSKASLEDEGGDNGGRKRGRGEDATSRIFNILRDYATVQNSTSVALKTCEAMVLRKGFTAQQLQTCLEEYQALDIIQVNSARTQVFFVEG
ncbi:Zygotic DNA replication licensing factor mcm3 [Seminavis robusta]|uniref:DNA helicase n=1 Tax=Seminavis robusta TaxID=568900 RepID=A0A9N8EE92_9STRA|nr:Zygotic DNA replication licensing factor mcm3 [Seminavis robusta]|eukprot:Sro1053_g235850.1 Zygotic DNA replication licensing factor mcm3 (880) ;mRNA; f:13614-16637